MTPDNTPILIGAGQFVMRDRATAENAMSPIDLAVHAVNRAVADTGIATLAKYIDTVAMVRTNGDSVPKSHAKLGNPFGRSNNPPLSVARRVGINPVRAIYSEVGGQSPQRLVNEFAERIHNGECSAVLIVGAEVNAITKQSLKAGLKLDWQEELEGPLEDRGTGPSLLTPYEMAHGMTFPLQVYPLLEQAWRHQHGFSLDQHRRNMAALFAPFSRVAATNPYAQFPMEHSEELLAGVTENNYLVSAPYTRWLVAQESVNQSAALILTSVGKARSLGIAPERWIYLHGYADADDNKVSLRPDLGRSEAMKLAANAALTAANRRVDEMQFIDLYSCFPVAVFAACEGLGIDWRNPHTALTVTGGLPFFGGPGNNYSLHAIAEMVLKLRAAPQAYGLVTANGGFLSKHSAGVYSAQPPLSVWEPCSSAALSATMAAQSEVAIVDKPVGNCAIESYVVLYGAGEPTFAYVSARDSNGGRLLAKVDRDDAATINLLISEDPIGKPIEISSRDDKNYFRFIGVPIELKSERPPEILRDEYQDCLVERRGAVLIITINRPSAMNAVTPNSNHELAQIFRAYESDSTLHVAIITGAGDKAFCAGNDLKFTAKATPAQMRQPAEGFGGLTDFFDRKKPVIAAVNGIAYGGGFEIALAADIVIASTTAKFALPEPKVGLAALAGGMHRLSRQIPLKKAVAMMITAESVGAQEGYDLGFINQVVDPEALLDTALQYAEKILACSPVSISITLEAVREGAKFSDLRDAMKLDKGFARRIVKSEDFKEGLKAFAEKRKPQWKGQ